MHAEFFWVWCFMHVFRSGIANWFICIYIYDNLEFGFIYIYMFTFRKYCPYVFDVCLFIDFCLPSLKWKNMASPRAFMRREPTSVRHFVLEMGVVQLGILLDGHVAICNIFDDESYFTMCYAYFPLARRKVPESAEPITPMVGGAEPTALALREPVGTRQIQVRARQPCLRQSSMATAIHGKHLPDLQRLWIFQEPTALAQRRAPVEVVRFCGAKRTAKGWFCNDLFLLADCMPGHHIVSLPFCGVVVTGLTLTTYCRKTIGKKSICFHVF